MSPYLNCPFCFGDLESFEYKSGKTFFCNQEGCVIGGDMPRFKAAYDTNEKLIYMRLMSNDLHIEEDFIWNLTSISKLQVCLIMNSVVFQNILPFDFKNPYLIFERAKKLLVFS